MADIGKIEKLSPALVPAGAFERLRRRLDEAPKGVDFHCAQCGALRISTFKRNFVYHDGMTCREADGQPLCEKLPSPTSEKIRPAYLPGSLVYVKGLPDPRDTNLPGMIEDDPYFENEFKLMCRDTKGNEIPMAYWVTFVSATSQYRGGWIRPENLVPFKPMSLACDVSSYQSSVQTQADLAFYTVLANRLKIFSFVVRACFLLKNPPPEPPELGPSIRALRARLAERDIVPERRPPQGVGARRPSSHGPFFLGGEPLTDPDSGTLIPWYRDWVDGSINLYSKGTGMPGTIGIFIEMWLKGQAVFYGHPAGWRSLGTSERRRRHTEDSDEEERKKRRRE